MVDQERITRAVREILSSIGDDPRREGLQETPQRVAAMYAEFFSGIDQDPRDALSVTFEEGHQELVIIREMPFFSICEHHLLPFFGRAHLAYVPMGRVAGVSKLARALETLARRPQMQERLTNQIADLMDETLQPKGTAVVLQAEHLCMTIRGVRSSGSQVVTTAYRGNLREETAARAEFLALIGRSMAV